MVASGGSDGDARTRGTVETAVTDAAAAKAGDGAVLDDGSGPCECVPPIAIATAPPPGAAAFDGAIFRVETVGMASAPIAGDGGAGRPSSPPAAAAFVRRPQMWLRLAPVLVSIKR